MSNFIKELLLLFLIPLNHSIGSIKMRTYANSGEAEVVSSKRSHTIFLNLVYSPNVTSNNHQIWFKLLPKLSKFWAFCDDAITDCPLNKVTSLECLKNKALTALNQFGSWNLAILTKLKNLFLLVNLCSHAALFNIPH